MLRHVEQASGYDRGIVIVAKESIEAVRLAARPARERGDAMSGRRALEIFARAAEFIERGAVLLEHRRTVRDDFRDPIECDAREAFGGVGLVHSEEIVKPPHALRKVGLGQ